MQSAAWSGRGRGRSYKVTDVPQWPSDPAPCVGPRARCNLRHGRVAAGAAPTTLREYRNGHRTRRHVSARRGAICGMVGSRPGPLLRRCGSTAMAIGPGAMCRPGAVQSAAWSGRGRGRSYDVADAPQWPSNSAPYVGPRARCNLRHGRIAAGAAPTTLRTCRNGHRTGRQIFVGAALAATRSRREIAARSNSRSPLDRSWRGPLDEPRGPAPSVDRVVHPARMKAIATDWPVKIAML